MALEQVSTFVLPNEYQRQATEARRRRRMAEMLAQQAYQPSDISAPIPTAAPLVQGLQAFLAARAERKADEAEESAKETASREARQYLKALTEEPDTTTDAVQPETKAAPTITMPQFEDGRITAPAGIEMGAPAPMVAPQIQLSRYNLTPGQRRAAALEGMLASENPMVQRIAGAIYPTLQPEKPKLQLGNIDPAKFTPASIADAMNSGDISKLQLIAPEGAAPTEFARLLSERNALPKNDPRRAAYDRRIAKETRIPGPTVINTGGGRGMGKPPVGYRYTAEGDLEAIPGGPADPSRERVMPAGITENVVGERARGRKFADIASRANDFISAIESGQLPLSPVSSAKYQAQRLLDSSRGVQPSEKEPYVRFFDLQRFVNEQVNSILNLAKGPQTEGDALRARQQILDNPNNEKVVVSALKDLQRISNKEVELSEQIAVDYERQYGRGAAASSPVEVDY